MFGQTLSSLILTKSRMQGKNGQREYNGTVDLDQVISETPQMWRENHAFFV
jgi:hypothetical protein